MVSPDPNPSLIDSSHAAAPPAGGLPSPRKVLVPVFLEVCLPDSEDEEHAEWLAGEVVRSMPELKLEGGATVRMSTVIGCVTKP